MTEHLWQRSACELAEGIRQRKYSCLEVMDSVAGRGLPAGVVPIGLVEGLPAGIQIVSRRFREDLILDAMAVVEDRIGVLAKTLWAREP
jgi:amidase